MINTIVLTVHNKIGTIDRILTQILATTSNLTQQIILVDDGSTDGTTSILQQYSDKYPHVHYKYTPDVWEVLANRAGLQNVETPYATIIQDDMLIHEYNWDRIMLSAAVRHNAFSISGRTGTDVSYNRDKLYLFNHIGREYPLGTSYFGRLFTKMLKIIPKPYRTAYSTKISRVFGPYKRDVVNRGPLIINMDAYNQLGGLDPAFAPFELDDVDLCIRATREGFGTHLVLPINYTEIGGSKKSNASSANASLDAINKNRGRVLAKHKESIPNKASEEKYSV